MDSFQVTTTPTSLTVEAGKSAVIAVVVSNRQGKPVMARVDMLVTPPSAAGWFTLAGAAQRKFAADPTATERFEFAVAVPATAATAAVQAIQFRADAVDVLAPDDHFKQGEVVALSVPAAKQEAPDHGGIPWWVWVIAAVVVLGAGIGIYTMIGRNRVPDVIGRSLADATGQLKARGFTTVNPTFVLDSTMELQSDQVVVQVPAGGSRYRKGDATAQVTVKRRTVTVPEAVGRPLAGVSNELGQRGLTLPEPGVSFNSPPASDGRVASIAPPAGALVGFGDTVKMVVFSKDPPCTPWPQCRILIWQRLDLQLREGVMVHRVP